MKILNRKKKNEIEELRKRGVTIGKNTDILDSLIDKGHGYLIDIGDNVTITGSTLLAHDASTKKHLGYTKVGKIKIGNNVFIGYGSIILPNVTIGDNVIVGAGSVVRKDIPCNSVVMGNPATVVCTFSEYIMANKKRMKKVPVYNTYWRNKTEDEKEKMKNEIGKWGGV
ncbi:acyltransferase [Lachnospiraceae bacterium 54-11]